MGILWFLIFLFVSHFFLMQIFRLTTYHLYFWRSAPLVLAFSALTAATLYWLSLHQFFLWYVAAEAAWLASVFNKQSKLAKSMLELSDMEAQVDSLLLSSFQTTKKYFFISAALHLITFACIYLWLYNR